MQEERINLGEMLIESGLISGDQLANAVNRQKQWGGRLGHQILQLGFINEITLIKFLSSQLNIPCADLTKIEFDPRLLSRIKPEIAKKHQAIPLEEKELKERKFLFVAMMDPGNRTALEEIAQITGNIVKPVITSDAQLESAIEKYYEDKGWVEIPPLKEKFDAISEDDIERIQDESTEKETEQAGEEEHVEKNLELLALIRVLVKEGLINKKDYVKELKQLKDQHAKEKE